MYFTCSLPDLLPAITLAEKAVSTQDSLEILKGILLIADQNNVTLMSNNLELAVKTSFPAKVTNTDQLVVDGKLLTAVIRKLPSENVIFESTNNQLRINSGKAEFFLNIIDSDDFPLIPSPKDHLLTITASKLIRMIKNTIYACGKDENRPFINGVLFELADKQLNFVATDINRLSYYAIEIETISNNEPKLLVPMKTLQELQRSIPNDDTEIKISQSDNYLIFEFEKTIMTTQLIDDRFPKYNSLFPKEEQIRITTERQKLISAVERAAIIDSDGGPIVIFAVENELLEIKTPSSTRGKSQEQMEVEHQGKNGEAAFSAHYMLDMLKAADSEKIIFDFNSDLRQCMLRPDSEDNHKYILMPIRLN